MPQDDQVTITMSRKASRWLNAYILVALKMDMGGDLEPEEDEAVRAVLATEFDKEGTGRLIAAAQSR